MDQNALWSLRLGFSNKENSKISQKGIPSFLEDSFKVSFDTSIPDFLKNSPKTATELKQLRQLYKNATPEEKKEARQKENQTSEAMKQWWIERIIDAEYPLQEKMTLLLHNHFVSTFQKVKVNYWMFQHNQILRKNAFGNFKTLTKEILKSNAMVRYLDNTDNKRGKINENLSRELLELFTLGIGNYTEDDVKNGAKGLAGLNLGEEGAQYRKAFEDNSTITYLGKTGVFKSDALVDIIFEQKNIPYLMTRKILEWFIYDNPKEELVQYYGDYFRKVDFEFKPLLVKIFTEEALKNTAGSKIKNPLEYSLQLLTELQLENAKKTVITNFLKQQSMDLFNQPNVKGWEGGKSWLTTQIYLQRSIVADAFCQGRININRKMDGKNRPLQNKIVSLNWQKGTNKTIIKELTDRLLFGVSPEIQKDLETVLKYDFDANAPNADQAVLRLFNTIIKEPEFQLI
ncbi:DUF1800 domain-containing protein [Flavobacterium hiemivividum]|uniref:DUF1800 domain-containing protein n=1 Tax=Flavobacterium hiemivividum TaxID=2541734 RepID=A0A4R5CYL0_9FLAO|nr:DUF1800 domain-containing protein [Flavobacterium hiemivividum]TDE04620.1 DUF1800 domain-containing protein [Flavobacterium hiemivividum]